jgi:hypothetical protein
MYQAKFIYQFKIIFFPKPTPPHKHMLYTNVFQMKKPINISIIFHMRKNIKSTAGLRKIRRGAFGQGAPYFRGFLGSQIHKWSRP